MSFVSSKYLTSPRLRAAAAGLGLFVGCAAASGQATFYSNDFETNDGGWTESGFGDWERGHLGTWSCSASTNPPHNSTLPNGTGMWATVLDGCHANSGADSIISQTFDLTGWTGLRLKFWSWVESGVCCDFDWAEVRVNGVQVFYEDDDAGGWVDNDIDISALADNNGSVLIEFLYHASAVVEGPGFYADLIRIEGNPASMPGVNTLVSQFSDVGDPVCFGTDTVVYNGRVTNFGVDPATNTMLIVPLPAGSSFVSGTNVTYNAGLNRVEGAFGSVANLQNVDFSFTINPPDTAGDYTLTATVSQTEADTDTSNNSAMVTTTVNGSAAPANDTCVAAVNLNSVGLPFAGSITNLCAGDDVHTDVNSPTAGGVWFTYTPPQNGAIFVSETGAQNVEWTLLSDCAGSAILSTADDDEIFFVSGGTQYFLLVGADSETADRSADLQLSISFSPAPANDSCGTAKNLNTLGLPASIVNVSEENVAANHDVDIGTCNTGDSAWGGVWYTYTASATGTVRFSEDGPQNVAWGVARNQACDPGTFERCTGTDNNQTIGVAPGDVLTFLVSAATETTSRADPLQLTFEFVDLPPNDNCVDAVALSLPTTVTANGPLATLEAGEPVASCDTSVQATVWYTWTATGSGNLRINETSSANVNLTVWTGGCAALSEVFCSGTDTNRFVPVTMGTQYWVRVANDSATAQPTSIYSIDFEFIPNAANDECAGAIDVFAPSTVIGNGQAASSSESVSCDTTTGFSLWYEYTATATGVVLFAETSTADVVHAVFDACGGSQIGCTTSESISVSVTNGQVILWRLAAASDVTAPTVSYSVDITFTPAPANDECAGAIDVFAPSTIIADARGATGAETVSCDTTTGFSLWYEYTAPAAGVVRFSETSSADANHSAFDACFGTELACTTAEALAVSVTSGQVILWRLAAGSDVTAPTVEFSVDITFTPAPANDECVGAIDVFTPSSILADARGASASETVSCDTTTGFSLWYRYTATATGALIVADTSTADANHSAFTACGGTELACTGAETMTLPVTSGQTYLLRLAAGSDVTAPTVEFAVDFSFVPPPANDACASAEPLSLSGGSVTVDARGAIADADVACNDGTDARSGVWYSISTMSDGISLVIDETSGNSVVYQFYTGSCGSLTPATCAVEATTNTFTLAGNTTYFLLVSSNSTAAFPTADYAFTYTVTLATGACCNGTSCSIATFSSCTGGGGSYVGDNASCAGAPQGVAAGDFPIPDYVAGIPGVVEAQLTVNDPITVSTVEVRMDINHTWVGDIELQLVAPNGTSAFLFQRPVSTSTTTPCPADDAIANGDDIVGAFVFSDAGTTTVQSAVFTTTAVPPGTYQAAACDNVPISLNGVFSGLQGMGTWLLRGTDRDASITGSFSNVQLVINGGLTPPCEDGGTPCDQADFDGSGTVNATDIFIFLDAWFSQNGQSGPNLSADTNGSGNVDATDIFIFLDLWFANNGMTC